MSKASLVPDNAWRRMRDDYIQGKSSLQSLARAYNIPHQAVKDRAAAESWKELRHDWVTERKLPAYAISHDEKLAHETSLTADFILHHHNNYLRRVADLDTMMTGMLEDARKPEEERKMQPREWQQLASAFNTLLERKRIMLGIPLPLPRKTREKPMGARSLNELPAGFSPASGPGSPQTIDVMTPGK